MFRLIRILTLWCSVTSVVAEPLRIVADEWPPYVDPTAPGRGLAIDLVTTAFSRAGYPTQLTVEDWSRSLEGAVIGVYDVVANLWYTDERARDLHYSDPYLVNDIRFVKRKGSDIVFDDYRDLRGRVIGIVKDYAYPQGFLRAGGLIKVVNDVLVQALSDLVAGRCDLVIDDKHVLDFTIRKYLPDSLTRLEYLPKPVGLSQLHVAVSRANPQHDRIVADFNRALRQMKADGSYARLLDAHGYQP
jgi:polar amino acid transport system substrate-binding protein